MIKASRIVAAIAGIALTPLALFGCASQEAFEEAIPPAVLAADPNIVDTHLSFAVGPAGRTVALRIYVTDSSDAAVADSMRAALDAAFHASPSRPTAILLDVAAAPRPEEVDLFAGQLSLDGVTPLLGLPGTVSDDLITLGAGELEAEFGAWEKP